MKPIFSKLLNAASLVICIVFVNAGLSGQITIDDTATPEELVESLVGTGVTVSGVTMDCPTGAFGFFDCVDCNVGISSGILLTSGSADLAIGPNNSSGATGGAGTPGDPDLDAIPGVLGTYDACVLEFDLTVTSDTIRFNYSFGSEEYLEFVGAFNDVFAFYISGPGIVGTENMALIPGTATPVSINNVNDVDNPSYYNINGMGWDLPFSADDYYIQYDGFTTVLEAKRNVIPCETYHLKMAIADDLDWSLDSGVFIEAGSLSSPAVSLSYETQIDGYTDIIEGCNDGEVTFVLSFAPVDTFIVTMIVDGTADNGIDYVDVPSELIFYPGDTMITITIDAIEDALAEGVETITIYVDLGCASGVSDTLTINVYDALPLVISPDTTICPGGVAVLTVTGGDSYAWTPAETLSDPADDYTEAYPTEPTVYTVIATRYSCVNSETVFVDIYPNTADAGNDTLIYFGETAYLDADGGVNYVWSPETALNDPNIENPLATPELSTIYTVTVTTDIGCIFTDNMEVVVVQPQAVVIPNAFTPNGDGLNDLLHISTFVNVDLNSFCIFNRWGQKIYETSDILAGWDGKYNNSDQEIGAYMYIFVGTDEENNEIINKGTITLLR